MSLRSLLHSLSQFRKTADEVELYARKHERERWASLLEKKGTTNVTRRIVQALLHDDPKLLP
ncbi:MAG TPA: hypothetical protein VE261_00580 [Gaiellaceae bacterium]|jgi:hypothetical protein|nr:hypothetical protein [Gaiellaceae bacterium]